MSLSQNPRFSARRLPAAILVGLLLLLGSSPGQARPEELWAADTPAASQGSETSPATPEAEPPEAEPALDPVVEASAAELRFLREETASRELSEVLQGFADALAGGRLEDQTSTFPSRVRARLPRTRGDAKARAGFVREATWSLEEQPRELSRQAFLEQLDAFLAPFAIEHVELEVLAARAAAESASDPAPTGPPAALDTTLSLAVVARNAAGHREWLRGTVQARAVAAEPAADSEPDARAEAPPGWRLASFEVEELTSLESTTDLLIEVSEAAGIAAADLPLAEGMVEGKHWLPHGAAAADVDRDGLLDLFVTGPDGNHLYINQGDGTFQDGAARAGLKSVLADRAECVPAFFDADNDGDLDLFLTSHHQVVVLENRWLPSGRLLFRNRSADLPQFPDYQPWSLALADVNRDGRVDLYVTNYASLDKGPYAITTIDDVAGHPNLLYLSQGDFIFREAGTEWGVDDARYSMAAQFADVNGDSRPDLYVTNDFGGGNGLYIHQGERYADQAADRGVQHAAESMGVSFADYDNDGDLDLHVTNMSSVAARRVLDRFAEEDLPGRDHLERIWSGNALFQNQGDGTFRDVTGTAGPFHGGWGWGGGFLDLDNDGFVDLHAPNGFFSGALPHQANDRLFWTIIAAARIPDREVMEKVIEAAAGEAFGRVIGGGYSFSGWQRDLVHLNLGDGSFLDISGISGADSPGDGWSTLYGDFDNDGDSDIFLRNRNGRSHFLYANAIGQERAFFRVYLEGRESGRDAFGAVVRLRGCRGRKGSAGSPRRSGEATATWPRTTRASSSAWGTESHGCWRSR